MPYIHPDDKRKLVVGTDNLSAGETAYCTTVLVQKFIRQLSFVDLATAIGILECTKLELYRRVVEPYEDYKREINGDAYEERLLKKGTK